MVDVTLRGAKGSPLTHDEVDANFTNLKTAVEANATSIAGAGGGLTVYSTIDDVPSSGSAGDMAFIDENKRMLVYTGTQWVSVTLENAKPTVSGNNAAYDLATDGTPLVVTLSAVDPEGADTITWSYTTDGLVAQATISQADNVFTITPSTNPANGGIFTITFRASDGFGLGTSSSVLTLDLFVQQFFPNQNEGVYFDFTNTDLLFQDADNAIPADTLGDQIASARNRVDLGGSASYGVVEISGDSDGVYAIDYPELASAGERNNVYFGPGQAMRIPTIGGDAKNFIFCFSASNISTTDSNGRFFTQEGAAATNGEIQVGLAANSNGYIFCKVAGTDSNFSVDSSTGVAVSSDTPQVITVLVQNGVATFRANGVDLGNSGGGGPSAGSAIGSVIGGGYQNNNYEMLCNLYAFTFIHGTFSSSDVDLIENVVAKKAGVTL